MLRVNSESPEITLLRERGHLMKFSGRALHQMPVDRLGITGGLFFLLDHHLLDHHHLLLDPYHHLDQGAFLRP